MCESKSVVRFGVLCPAVCVCSAAHLYLPHFDLINCSPPGSSVLECLPFPPPRDLPDPGIEPSSPSLAGKFFASVPPGKPEPGGTNVGFSLWTFSETIHVSRTLLQTPQSLRTSAWRSKEYISQHITCKLLASQLVPQTDWGRDYCASVLCPFSPR